MKSSGSMKVLAIDGVAGWMLIRKAGLYYEIRERLIAAPHDEHFTSVEVKRVLEKLFPEALLYQIRETATQTRLPRPDSSGFFPTFHATRRLHSTMTARRDWFETESLDPDAGRVVNTFKDS